MSKTEKTICIYCQGQYPKQKKYGLIEVNVEIGTKTQKIKCECCNQITRNRVFKNKITKSWRADDNK